MRSDLNRFSSPDDIAQRLRALPGEPDVPYDWAEFRSREKARHWRPRAAVKWQHAATAAGVTVFIAVMAMWGRSAQHTENVNASAAGIAPQSQQQSAQGNETYEDKELGARIAGLALEATAAAIESQRLNFERAQASQRWLERQPAEPAVVRVGPRLAVANLEDRIAWLDDAVTDEQFGSEDATHVAALQQERARLVNSLAQVRYAETLAAVN